MGKEMMPMRWLTIIMAAVLSAILVCASLAGENLCPEVLLPALDSAGDTEYPGGKDAYYPDAAFGSSTGSGQGRDVYLVAWQAGRWLKGDIAACLIGKDGNVLNDKPIVISAAKDDQERPKVAFGSGVFLVVWSDLRNEKDYDVYAARVTPDGKVLDPDGILISGGTYNQMRPALAFDGENFLVAWEALQANNKYQVFCTRVSANGKVLDPAGVALTSGKADARYLAVASAGGGRSLVVMNDFAKFGKNAMVHGGVFVRGGKPTGEELVRQDKPANIKGGQERCNLVNAVTVATGKEGFLLAYRNAVPEGRGGLNPEFSYQVVRPDGKREPLQSVTGGQLNTYETGAAWDGTTYVSAWHNHHLGSYEPPANKPLCSKVYACRIDENGKLLTEVGADKSIAVSGTPANPAQRPALASDGAGTVLIAYERHPEKGDVPIKIGFRLLNAK